MSAKQNIRNGKVPIKGLFMNSIWHCDCDTRLLAEKFQVKNGGKNHGRWFYTCQKPQTNRCSFFLWNDDAKIREESAILSNSKSEPAVTSADLRYASGNAYTAHTPKRQDQSIEVQKRSTFGTRDSSPTPVRNLKHGAFDLQDARFQTNSPKIHERFNNVDVEWSENDDDDAMLALIEDIDSQKTVSANDSSELPRKVAKTPQKTSPGKRSHDQFDQDSASNSTWSITNFKDGIATPVTSTRSIRSVNITSPDITSSSTRRLLFQADLQKSPTSPFLETPATVRTVTHDHLIESGNLATSVISLLSPIQSSLPHEIETAVVDLLNKHELRALGVSRGRDIARQGIQKKEIQITQLHQRIEQMEEDKTTQQVLANHYKSEIFRLKQELKKHKKTGEA